MIRYLSGPPSHVTLLFEYQTPTLYGIQVSGIQMVTVINLSNFIFADGSGRRARHAADRSGAVVHVVAHVRQCGQVFRKLSS